MILQRLTNALRKQDWFTVTIETFILVFGVFLGIQASNENAARIDAADQASLLQRLATDFSDNEPVMQAATKRLDLAAGQTRRLIDYLRAGDETPADKDILSIVEAPSRLAFLPPVTATCQEMLSTGGLARIRSQDLRSALVR